MEIPVTWGNIIYERWIQLNNKVSDRLHTCATSPDTLALLQESIYTEAENVFRHLQPKKRDLAGQS